MDKMKLELISVHVPKCAGSSFRETLERAYSTDAVAFDYGDRPVDPCSPGNLDPVGYVDRQWPTIEANIQNKLAVHGHFRASKYDFAGDSCARITFLRHPVDRLISHYYFWLSLPRHGHSLQDYLLDHELTLIQFAQLPYMQYFYTGLFFQGVDMKRFDFIGRCDAMPTEIERLGTLLGRRLEMRHTNINSYAGYQEVRRHTIDDASTLSTLKSLLADDIRFYERALS
ncbi:MAG: hypothetical protein K0R85_1027 [Devosia sp.]|jgi:hypothetical protein|nr:hypothetical protein [Devosia sp.]